MNNKLILQANKGITIANYLASTLKILRLNVTCDQMIPDYRLRGIAKALHEIEEELRKCRQSIEDECIGYSER